MEYENGNHWGGKRILITGGTGFVGNALYKKLVSLGGEVFRFNSLECNLEYPRDTDEAFKKRAALDYIFHLASWTKPGPFCLYHSAEQYHRNTLIHVNVLSAWHRFHPQAKLIGIGSSCSYPGAISELHETDYWNGEPHESLLAYAMTKRMLYAGQIAYGKQYGLKSIHPIFATVYGPDDYFDEERSHCASALIRRFCIAAHRGDPEVVVWGDGSQEREFVYIDDQIDGLLVAAQYHESGLINLGTNIKTRIRDLVGIIAGVCGYLGNVRYDETKFVGIKTKSLNSDMAYQRYGWVAKTTVADGVANTVRWYIENRLRADIGACDD
ncbi:MAG: NAD-dependent epimerase/dehydratase family protein [bacterium]